MITTFHGILNVQTQTLCFSNAGHLYPILKRDGQVRDLELPGLPLKALPTATYQEQLMELQPGDQLILATDGIVETMNEERELFGFKQLAHLISQLNATARHEMLDVI
jgi:serine phosphatase RsbU (regulator of sigma subunit)